MKKPLVVTQYEGTGARVFHKKEPFRGHLDIIVDTIDKEKGKISLRWKAHTGPIKSIELGIGEDYYLTRNIFFGVQKNQGENRPDEVRVGYKFPEADEIQKGWFRDGEFIPCYGEYLLKEIPANLKSKAV